MAKRSKGVVRISKGLFYDLVARLDEVEARLGPWGESVERRVTNVTESCGFLPARVAQIENRLNAIDAIFRRLEAAESKLAALASKPTVTIQHAEVKL